MSLMDFSNLEKEITDAPEPRILNKGEEVEVRIISVNEGMSDKNGARWFQPRFDVPRDPMVKEFTDFMWNPADNSKLDEKQKQRNNYHLKQFFTAFKVDLSKPFAFEDLIGKKGWIIAGQQSNDQYGLQNNVSKYIISQGAAVTVDSSY